MTASSPRLISAPPLYSASEEVVHSVTHGFGVVISIAGLIALVVRAANQGAAIHVISCAIFSAALIFMYIGSTVYHAISQPKLKMILRKVDQSTVYLLIAGTYTPLCLVTLHGIIGWSMFCIAWVVSLAGMYLCVVEPEWHERYALTFYLGLGWAIMLALKPLLERMDTAGVALIFGGGLCYTIGTLFYLRETRPYFHAIWHVFVLAGTALHYFTMFYYVIPDTTLRS